MNRSILSATCMLILLVQAVAAEPQPSRLAGTTALVVYRLAGPSVGGPPSSLSDNPRIEGYHILDFGVVTRRDKIQHVLAVITTALKAREAPSACFQPGMAIGFVGPSGVTNVLVCLDCLNISVPGSDRLVGISKEATKALAVFYAEMFRSTESDAR